MALNWQKIAMGMVQSCQKSSNHGSELAENGNDYGPELPEEGNEYGPELP